MPEESSTEVELCFNGINAETGEYDLPPMTGEKLWSFIEGEQKPENLNELRFRHQQKTAKHLGVKAGVDPKKLDETGWGVIFAHDADPEIEEALGELLKLRKEQAGEHYRIYKGTDGHRPREKKSKFLARHGAGPGPADPDKVPYYLLIVGDPDRIPYRFQTQLDVQYAVGRIHFDTLDEYANYAQSVVAAETGRVKLPRTASFFGVANEGDQATQLSAKYLVEPLYEKFKGEHKEWQFSAFMKEQATKEQLSMILGGDQAPSLLFSASHGMSFNNGSNEQYPHQGALLCQNWGGPGTGPISRDAYFSGMDLTQESNLLGLIAFFFACYGGGTPRLDEFSKQAFKDQRVEIAPHNFLAQLPTKMLSRPRGGALAVIGHVERAWGYSFIWPGAGAQTEVFASTLLRLLEGHPVGSAIEYFNERYAELSTMLSDEIEEAEFSEEVDAYEMAGMWTANNDARGYAVIGDPAVRLPVVEEGEETSKRPVIDVRYVAPEGKGATEQAAEAAESTPAGETEPSTVEGGQIGGQAAQGYYVPQEILDKYPELSKELYGNWVRYVQQGYKRNDIVFQKILNTFLSDHNLTVGMYAVLFTVGVGLFVIAAILAVTEDNLVFKGAALFGGLGVVAFLRYFISRSVESIEENLEFITWLGLIYNTYWTRLAWTFEYRESQKVVKETTEIALKQLERMIDKHAVARGKRYTPKDDGGGGGGE